MNIIDIRNPSRKIAVERIIFADEAGWSDPTFITNEGELVIGSDQDECMASLPLADIPNLILALQRAVAEGWVPGLPKVESPEKAPVKKPAAKKAAAKPAAKSAKKK